MNKLSIHTLLHLAGIVLIFARRPAFTSFQSLPPKSAHCSSIHDLVLSAQSRKTSIPPIPDPTANPSDDFFRWFRRNVPPGVQHWMRDSGVIRLILDSLVWTAIPKLIQEYPWAVVNYLQLTGSKKALQSWWEVLYSSNLVPRTTSEQKIKGYGGLFDDLELQVNKYPYGSDKRQFVSIISSSQSLSCQPTSSTIQRTIVFVHGGAWGSGFPGMYALMAIPFLNAGYSHVALVGYRTYPSATLDGQVDDVAQALENINIKTNNPITVIGHSSGSHLLTMAFLQRRLVETLCIDQFVALSGVYDIPSHYKWERDRGIERISPMSAACGSTLTNWKRASPQYIVATRDSFPSHTLFAHGTLDCTVPYTATQRFAESIGLEGILWHDMGHADMMFELMFGGTTRDILLDWIRARTSNDMDDNLK